MAPRAPRLVGRARPELATHLAAARQAGAQARESRRLNPRRTVRRGGTGDLERILDQLEYGVTEADCRRELDRMAREVTSSPGLDPGDVVVQTSLVGQLDRFLAQLMT